MDKIRNLRIWVVASILYLGMVCTAAGQIVYVDADATGANNGSSWADAYNYLQDALAAAVSGDEIWVAEGVYKPDEDTANPDGTGDQTATFQLMNGVAIRGGYAAYGAGNPDARNVDVYETILSGDLNGDDDGFSNNGENSYHVVTGSGTDVTAVLEGFTISAGNGFQYEKGGGMYNYRGSPTVANCTFGGNWAYIAGGMYNSGSSPTVANCKFIGNSAETNGGAMVNDCVPFGPASYPTLVNCTFRGNRASYSGGMSNSGWSGPTLTNCTFIGNVGTHSGGGMSNGQSNVRLTNCTLIGNLAGAYGGGINSAECYVTLTNCTLTGNSAGWGGGMAHYIGGYTKLTNCVLWGNNASVDGAQIYVKETSLAPVDYSDVQDGWLGEGNIDADPLFVDAANGDYHLLPGSPCIDTGTNTPAGGLPSMDIEGNPRPVDGDGDGVAVADMGAYEAIMPTIQVAIDIKPGSYPNAINLGSYGLVPVAILSSADFDARTVNPDTVRLGGAGVAVRGKGSKSMAHQEDVNGDGLVDLIVQIETTNLDPGSFQDGNAVLTGETYDGQAIQGQDEITIVPTE